MQRPRCAVEQRERLRLGGRVHRSRVVGQGAPADRVRTRHQPAKPGFAHRGGVGCERLLRADMADCMASLLSETVMSGRECGEMGVCVRNRISRPPGWIPRERP